MDTTLQQAVEALRNAELAKNGQTADAGAPVAAPSESEQGGGIGEFLGGIANAGVETFGRLMRGEADPEFSAAVTNAETELDNTVVDPNREPGLHEKAVATMAAIPTGAVEAGFNTVDGVKSLVGIEPGPKSEMRSKVEALDEALRGKTTAAGFASSLSSFAVGLIGAGKVLGPLKAVSKGKAATVAYETAKGAVAGFFSMDPHEERLSNIVQQFPSLENPVNAYLAANEDDSEIEGRLKNALEGVGMDIAVAGLFAGSLKVLKLLRSDKKEEAKAAAESLSTAAQEVEAPRPVSDADVMAAIEGRPVAKPEEEAVNAPVQAVPAQATSPEVGVGNQAAPVSAGAGTGDVPAGNPAAGQAVPLDIPEAPKADLQAVPQVDQKPTVQLGEDSVSNILAGTKADLKTVEDAGGVAAAIGQGLKLDNMTAFPWKRMITGDDVDVLVENAVKEAIPEINAMKGGDVLHDAAVQQSLKDIAKAYRVDPQMMLGELSQAGEAAVDSVKRMEAGHLIFRKMSLDVTTAIKKFNAGQFGEFGTEEAARGEIKRRLALMLEVYGNTQAIISNAGRVVRRQRAEFDQLGEALKLMGKVDDQHLFRKIEQMDGNPDMIKEAIKPGFWRRVQEEASFSMRNGLLWLYPTHFFNMTGNVMIGVLRPLETAIGGTMVGAKGAYLRGRAIKEYLYTAASTMDGLKAALKTAVEGDGRLSPHTTESITGGEMSTNIGDLRHIPLVPVSGVGDIWTNSQVAFSYLYRNGTGLPSRMMGTQDEFFKIVRYRGYVQANAAISGAKLGLTGKELKDYVAQKLASAFDSEGRGIDEVALKEAQSSTLNNELLPGTIGATIRNARGQHPWLGMILPYIKTPINALRYSQKYTPGLNMLQKEFRQDILGANGLEAQARAIGQASLGSMVVVGATLLAAQGRITGGGPTDKKLRKVLTDDGWRPYSVRIENEDGSTSYVSYNRMDPVSLPFAIAADAYEGYVNGADVSDVLAAVGLAVAKNFNERGFTLNLQAAMEALTDPEARGAAFVGRLMGSTIPASSALRGYVNDDQYMREAQTLLDHALKDMPGYSETLPVHRDPFGEPVMRRIGIRTDGTSDLVNLENDRMILESGFGVTAPNPVRDGVDLRKLTLESGQNAFDRYQELMANPESGQVPLKKALAKLIGSREYQELLDGAGEEKGSKLYALQKVIVAYRDSAYSNLLANSKVVQNEVLKKKYSFAASAADKANGNTNMAEQLLNMIQNNQ